jgi:WD40 repeat protein/DNA-binding SARP family transcriptional activator
VVRFRILGPIELSDGERPLTVGGPRQLALLAYLLLHANRAVSADQLIDALWAGQPAAGAVKRLQVAVTRLRKALDADPGRENSPLRTVGGGYLLVVQPGELDAEVFQRRVEEGHQVLDDRRPADAAVVLRDALTLWRGPPLAEVAFADFAQPEVRRLEELRLRAAELAIEADLAAGRHRELLGEIEALVTEQPLRERPRAQHMLALYRSGRQAEALADFHAARRALLAELGVEPGPDLSSLHEAILRHDASLELAPAANDLPAVLEAAATTPFVARQDELRRLRERWAAVRRRERGTVVAIVGDQGMGKTRLAAELAAAVHEDGGFVLYAAGGGASSATLAAIARAADAQRPTMLAAEDLDRASAEVVDALERLNVRELPLLVVASAEAAAPVRADATLVLEAIDDEAVGEIARLYTSAEPLSLTSLAQNSRGVPGRVHELADRWARESAARRVDATAGRAALGRTELRGVQAELARNVIDFEAARERAGRLAGAPDDIVPCPFKGLAAFEFDDAEYFFGRERLVAELVTRTVGASLLGVVGPSGSGKSSVVRAGLLPALAGGVLPGSGSWERIVIRPGEHPLRAIEQATPRERPSTRVVLAVDQFEETFTACRDELERHAFVERLVRMTVDGPTVVVLALRADFYGRCAAYPELSALIGANHVLVGAMRRDELRRAIERPAERAGLQIEPDLVDALLSDVESAPGGLPLLSTALLELWLHRDARRLRLSAYRRSGGISEAVARSAEEVFGRLPPAQQAVAQNLLLRLAGDDGAGGVVRRQVPMTELEDAVDVVTLLVDQRLLTINDGAVEVAHEALLREWPRLRDWLEDDADGRRVHHHLANAARDWHERGRDRGDLYRGARLAAAVEWRAQHEQDVNRTERAFLDASLAAEQSEREAANRRTRRLRALALGLAALVLVSGISAVLAVRQTQRAESEKRTAISQSLAAQGLSQLERDLDVAALLSLEAYRTKSTLEARNAVLSVLPGLERAAGILMGPIPSGVAFSRDGTTLASADGDGTVRLWDVAARRPLGQPLRGHAGPVSSVAFTPDGTILASASRDANETVRLWDVAARRPLGQPLKGHTGGVHRVAFTPDGATLASAGQDETVRLWDVATRRPLGQPLKGHTGPVYGVAVNRDGTTLASAGEDAKVRLWDVAARRPLGPPLKGHTGRVLSVAFNRDGTALASAGDDGLVRLWDVAAGRALSPPLAGHSGSVYDVAFTPDGTTLASAGYEDKTVRLWDVATRRPLGLPLKGHTGGVLGVALSPDGARLASAGVDGTVRLWDVTVRRLLGQPLKGHTGGVYGVAFTPDGATLASAGPDGTVRLWDVSARRPLGEPLRGHTGEVNGVGFNRDGTALASAGEDGTIRLWDVAARRQLDPPLRGHTGPVSSVAFSHDGATMASAGFDKTVRLWDVAGRRPLGQPLKGHTGDVWGVALSPDGARLASAGEDRTVRLWDVAARRPLGQPLKGHTGGVRGVAFSPDGARLASAGIDGTVRLWDVAARRQLGPPLKGHTGPVSSVAFTPDGTTLASAGSDTDGTLRFWDLATRRPLGQPLTAGYTTSVAFSPDGTTLASAPAVDNETVWLWDPTLWSNDRRTLHRRVCETVQRNLSHAEWAQFLPRDPYHQTCGPLP